MKTTFTKNLAVLVLTTVLDLNATEPVLKPAGISFAENKGQVCDQKYNARPDVLFTGVSNGMAYHLTQKGISYQLNRVDRWKEIEDIKSNTKFKTPDRTTIYRVDINWIGADRNSTISKGTELPGCDNYYLPQCPKGVLNVKKYETITYNNIYAGIDLTWYEKNGELEYDFILKPNADPKQIKIEISGAEKLSINKNGELEIKTPLGTIIEKAPLAFQDNKKIKTEWQLRGKEISFKVSNYDHNLALTIDPVVRVWGTYYGGSGDDKARSVTTDSNGDVYMLGYTTGASSTVIATTGSYQTAFAGGTNDAFLVKFNSSGIRQWSTYFGGGGNDLGNSVAIDFSPVPDIYIAGNTDSPSGIATVGSYQLTNAGASDAFLAKFNTSGILQWATYCGDPLNDYGEDCKVDAMNNIILAGSASSSTVSSIGTSGSHQVTNAGGIDGFIVKFNPAGAKLMGTYYGGFGTEYFHSCAVDLTTNSIYACGRTTFSGGTTIATTGGHQSANGGGNDGYLVKLDQAGVRQWGTYYGGAGSEESYGCILDNSGNVFLAGYTTSSGGTIIATAGAFQTLSGGSFDGYLAKFNSLGVRQWGTYIGGAGSDYSESCEHDQSGNIYIGGRTTSVSNIATAGNHQTSFGGSPGSDAYLMKFDALGNRIYGTYYGAGATDDYCYDVAPDLSNINNVYLTGYSASASGTIIATTGSHQQSHGGGTNDAFLAKFSECNVSVSIVGTNTICSGSTTTLTVSGATTYSWNTGATTATILVSPFTTTVYTATGTIGSCSGTNTINVTVLSTPTVNVSASSSTICAGDSTILTASGAASYFWSSGVFTATSVVSPTVSSTYTVDGYGAIGCSDTKTIGITVNALPSVSLTASSNTICTSATGGTTLSLSGSPSGGVYSGANVTGPVFNAPAIAGTYTAAYTYTDVTTGCYNSTSNTTTVNVCTSLNESGKNTNEILIYPNPCNGNFIITVPEKSTGRIYNSLGQIVSLLELEKGKNKIVPENLSDGIYFVGYRDYKYKFIIQH